MSSMLQSTVDRLVFDTGPRSSNSIDTPSSLTRLANHVNVLLEQPELLRHKKEVVVTGGWTFSKDAMDVLMLKYGELDLENAIDTDADEPLRTGDLTRARSQSSAAQNATPRKHDLEWSFAGNLLVSILEKIEVDYIRWETDLPFTKDIWAVIPKRIKTLSLNLFVPDAEDRGELEPHPEYFTLDDIKYLTNFKHLQLLRVYNMAESFQSIIWETVWKNPNLTTLELEMRHNPITRGPDKMTVIDRTWEYNAEGDMTEKYRGSLGSGMLHHTYGYGEYLDRQSIRNARIEAMKDLQCELHAMPLKTLRLGNFVVDYTSFSEFFDNLVQIVFTRECVDAGLVLPKHLDGKVELLPPYGDLGITYLGFTAGGSDSEDEMVKTPPSP